MAALPILKAGRCWRVGDGASIKILVDKCIPKHPTNKVLYPTNVDVGEWLVIDLIEPGINYWKQDLVMTIFRSEDAEAICRIPLSRRQVADSIIWMHNRNGRYSVKFGYYVARQVMRNGNWVECSRRNDEQKVWKALWRMKVPNKIKIFKWRACHGILPTRLNLAKRKIIVETVCPICLQSLENEVHVLWDYPATQDVWAGSQTKLQKCPLGQQDVLQLFDYLMHRLEPEEIELFLVQAWMLWNQQNCVLHGGKLKDLGWLNTRAEEWLDESAQAQEQLAVTKGNWRKCVASTTSSFLQNEF